MEKTVNTKRAEERKSELTELLSASISERKVSKSVELLIKNGYRAERYGEWRHCPERTSKRSVWWMCSACEHWQITKHNDISGKICYMNYCPFCGAKMKKPEDREWVFGL